MTKLTVSEARAEAAIVVLKFIVAELRRSERQLLEDSARKAADDIGDLMVTEEIDWFFTWVRR